MSVKETVAIVANDSGGAEILSSWALRSNYNYIFVVQGPAENIFFRKIPHLQIYDLNTAIDRCDWVLTETGGSTNLNCKAILTAKKKKKRVVSFLDHWSAYEGRFTRNNVSIFPDEIWAGDIDSYNLAKLTFPQKIVKLKDNPYLQNILEDFNRIESDLEKYDFLYVSSNFDNPHREKDCLKISDVTILRKIINQIINYVDISKNIVITIRAHPSEDISKYYNFVSPFMKIRFDIKQNLVDSIQRHKYIVGSNSMALVVGKIIGKITINAILKENLSTLPSKYVDHTIIVND